MLVTISMHIICILRESMHTGACSPISIEPGHCTALLADTTYFRILYCARGRPVRIPGARAGTTRV